MPLTRLADQSRATAVATVPNTVYAGSLGFFLQSWSLSWRHLSLKQRIVPPRPGEVKVPAGSVDRQAMRGASALYHLRRPEFGRRATQGCDRTLACPWPSAWAACLWFLAAVPELPDRSPSLRLATTAS